MGLHGHYFSIKKMSNHARKNKFEYFYLTIFIVIVSVFCFLINKNLFYIYFFSFNAWHVIKQSFGICKLYSSNKAEIIFQRNVIFILNFFILLCGSFLYLMFGLISENFAKRSRIFILSLNLIVFVIQIIKYKKLENAFLTLTGIVIFLPSFFVSKTIHALLAGVTMHYSQYIAITLKIYLSKNNMNLENLKV